MKKKIILSTIALLILVVVLIFSGKWKSDPSSELYTNVKQGTFSISVAVTGELLAEHSEDIMGPIELRSPLLGFMQVKIQDLIPEGTVVDSGQYVATLDRTEVSNKLKDIDDEVQNVQSQFTNKQLDSTMSLREARNNLLNMKFGIEEKQLVLSQSKFEAPATIRQAQIELDKSNRAYEQEKKTYNLKVQQFVSSMNEVAVRLAQVKRRREAMSDLIAKFVIKAPRPGMVIYSKDWGGNKRKVGSTITPWELQVATLPDMSRMLSKTYVNEIDISKVRVGQNVKVTLDAFPDKIFTGTVLTIANVGEQLPNTDAKVFEVTIRINESDDVMRPSMTTSNVILIREFKNVLYLPIEATHVSADSMTFVYTKRNAKHLVLLGPSNENDVIVEKGLNPGDEVYLTIPSNATNMKITGGDLKTEILNKKKVGNIAEKQIPPTSQIQ